MQHLLNLGLRAATLGSKFILIFFLARFLDPEAVGLYGLLAAAIGYALYLIGLDFYTYSTREILRFDRGRWGELVRNHGTLVLLLYIVILPLLLLIFWLGFLPWFLAPWFYLLLVLEHLNQELSRLLVAVSKQVVASLVMFFRQGLWCLVIIGLMVWIPSTRQMEAVLIAWCVGGILALSTGVVALRALDMQGWGQSVDWAWILQGIKVAVPLLVGTLALRSLFTIDRYWFADLNSLQILGAYVLFIGMCNALMSFLDAGVFAFAYPAIISAYYKKDEVAFRYKMRQVGWLTLIFCMLFVLISILILGPILNWLGRPIYIEHRDVFYWLLLPTCLFVLSMIPQLGLYARGRDRSIVNCQLAGVPIFIVFTLISEQVSHKYAVPVGLTAAMGSMLIWKSVAYRRMMFNRLRMV